MAFDPNKVGSATLDFGVAPGGNVASVVVTGSGLGLDFSALASTSMAEAFMAADDSTADHNTTEHSIVPIKLTCGTIVIGTSFVVYGYCDWRLSGTFAVRWVWA